MKRTPVLTLLAGLAVAAVLLVMSMIAAKGPSDDKVTAANDFPAGTAAPTLSPTPSPSAAAPAKVNATWAGVVDGGKVTIAIAVKDGVAIAYLCDGKKIEAWLQGTAEAGKLTLTGKDGSALTGTFGGGKATGKIVASGKAWTFTAPTAQPPGGLYRTAQLVSTARVVCGWIVLADGSQVGVCTPEGKEPEPAPRLDVTTAQPINPQDPS
jgi:serine/threonine-protein kinase